MPSSCICPSVRLSVCVCLSHSGIVSTDKRADKRVARSLCHSRASCYHLLAIGAERVETHQHAKLYQNRSIGCDDIKIFRFFKMAAAAIFHYPIRKILFAVGVWRPQTHHCTKFRQNRSFLCGEIGIFQIFKMAAAAILNFFEIVKFYWLLGPEGRDASACQILSK